MSVAVHVTVLAGLWYAQRITPDRYVYEVVQVQMVSPPPAQSEAPPAEEPTPAVEEDLTIETPFEEEVVEDQEAPVVVDEEPDPTPPEDPAPVEETPPPDPTETTPTSDASDEETTDDSGADDSESEESGEDVNVRLEGLRRDYPAYYANIIAQIRRCFRPDKPGQEATVSFVIYSDGTTGEFDVTKSSGNFGFDLDAMAAVECAGRPGRIGPLPDGFPWEVLPIEFTLTEAPRQDLTDGTQTYGDPESPATPSFLFPTKR